MNPSDEITAWMDALANESPTAAEQIWRHFYTKIVRHAAKKLKDTPRRIIDEEAIASEAMASLFQGVRDGRFPQFANRDDLWRILLTITTRKAHKAIRREMTQKRGTGQVRGESIFLQIDDRHGGFAEIAGAEPTPEFAQVLSEKCEEYLHCLAEPTLRKIATMKLQGYHNDEIAIELDCAVRSVERKLNRIRAIWEGHEHPPSE